MNDPTRGMWECGGFSMMQSHLLEDQNGFWRLGGAHMLRSESQIGGRNGTNEHSNRKSTMDPASRVFL